MLVIPVTCIIIFWLFNTCHWYPGCFIK